MRKTDRAKALEITLSVKRAVAARDSVENWPCCIFCGAPAPVGGIAWSNAHFVPRSQGGLGIEQNVLTVCPDCHWKMDQTVTREAMLEYAEQYLKSKYKSWTRTKCIYRPWKGRNQNA